MRGLGAADGRDLAQQRPRQAETRSRRRPVQPVLENVYLCEPAQPRKLLGDVEASLRSCKLRDGGWPAFILAARPGGKLVGIEGLPDAMPAVEAALALMAGRPAPAASGQGLQDYNIKLLQETLGSGFKNVGLQDMSAARNLERLARELNNMRDFDAAIEANQRWLELVERINGRDSPNNAEAMSYMMLNFGRAARWQELEAVWKRLEPLLPVAPDRNWLPQNTTFRAGLALQRGDLVRAKQLAEEAITYRRERLGQRTGRAFALANYRAGQVYAAIGDLPGAERAMRDALSNYQGIYGNVHYWVAASRLELGGILAQAGKQAEAEAELREAVRQFEVVHGDRRTKRARPDGAGPVPDAHQSPRRGDDGLPQGRWVRGEERRDRPQMRVGTLSSYYFALAPTSGPVAGDRAAELFTGLQIPLDPVVGQAVTLMSARVADGDPAARNARAPAAGRDRGADQAALAPRSRRGSGRGGARRGRRGRADRPDPRRGGEARTVRGSAPGGAAALRKLTNPPPMTIAEAAKLLKPARRRRRRSDYAALHLRGADPRRQGDGVRGRVRAAAARAGDRRAAQGRRLGAAGSAGISISPRRTRSTPAVRPARRQPRRRQAPDPRARRTAREHAAVVSGAEAADGGRLRGRRVADEGHGGERAAGGVVAGRAAGDGQAVHGEAGLHRLRQPGSAARPTPAARASSALGKACRINVDERADPALLQALAPLPETADEIKAMAASLKAPADSVVLGRAASEAEIRKRDLTQYRVPPSRPTACCRASCRARTSRRSPSRPAGPDRGRRRAAQRERDRAAAAGRRLGRALGLQHRRARRQCARRPGAVRTVSARSSTPGSRAVLATHWAVASEPTVTLTTGTFDAFAKPGTGRAEALRQSQLAMLKNPQTQHPVFWAPFVVVGEGRAVKYPAIAALSRAHHVSRAGPAKPPAAVGEEIAAGSAVSGVPARRAVAPAEIGAENWRVPCEGWERPSIGVFGAFRSSEACAEPMIGGRGVGEERLVGGYICEEPQPRGSSATSRRSCAAASCATAAGRPSFSPRAWAAKLVGAVGLPDALPRSRPSLALMAGGPAGRRRRAQGLQDYNVKLLQETLGAGFKNVGLQDMSQARSYDRLTQDLKTWGTTTPRSRSTSAGSSCSSGSTVATAPTTRSR